MNPFPLSFERRPISDPLNMLQTNKPIPLASSPSTLSLYLRLFTDSRHSEAPRPLVPPSPLPCHPGSPVRLTHPSNPAASHLAQKLPFPSTSRSLHHPSAFTQQRRAIVTPSVIMDPLTISAILVRVVHRWTLLKWELISKVTALARQLSGQSNDKPITHHAEHMQCA